MHPEPPPTPPTVPLTATRRPVSEMRARADSFFDEVARRRTVRDFSPEPIPLDVVRRCIEAAAQAPSGAHKQPWTFALVTDAATKTAIRAAAEEEERAFYAGRAPQAWIDDLRLLGTDADKPFLEIAPALVIVFAQIRGPNDAKHYYVKESVGIATGVLLTALHHCGLATLTHTPSPMGFLERILERPANERAFVLIPVGYPAVGCRVPDLERKPLEAVLVER